MKLFKTLVITLIIGLSLSAFAQTNEEKLQDNFLFIRSIPDIQDFINNLLNPSRDDLRNRPGNTQSA